MSIEGVSNDQPKSQETSNQVSPSSYRYNDQTRRRCGGLTYKEVLGQMQATLGLTPSDALQRIKMGSPTHVPMAQKVRSLNRTRSMYNYPLPPPPPPLSSPPPPGPERILTRAGRLLGLLLQICFFSLKGSTK